MSDEISIEDKLIYNNNKLVADKIRKTLMNIRNIPGISAKRWVWEMIQNAKDVPNNFGKVEIKFELKQKSLIFSHNGSYFLIDNVLGLLQQVSSKDSKNNDKTGKFGTGFIGTHLLSTKITVKGIVKYRGLFRRFEINLDRSAESSEELLKEVSKSIIEFKDNMNNLNSKYEPLHAYNQKQEDFDTIFEYHLENEEAIKIAIDGLNDLKNTAPVTLSTQCKNISSIEIINEIDNEICKYTISNTKKKKNIYLNTATITNEKTENKIKTKSEKKIYFFSYENEKCRLLYQVAHSENGYQVVERKEKEQPILLRDFPLIGSEKFHFPFFLDGFKFNPLETRNGLFLNGTLNKEAVENRIILENAIEGAIEFTKYLIDQNINKRYILAKTNIPEPPMPYDKYAIDWFIDQQIKWRKELIKIKLLRDEENSYSELEELKLPQFKEKCNKKFYGLLKTINLTGGILPNEEDFEFWYDIMEKDPLREVYNIKKNTWGFSYLFTEEALFLEIEKFNNIQTFAKEFDKSTGEILDWLNILYCFLNEENYKDCLNKYRLIPNQKGIFKKANEINGNDDNLENKIPDIMNKIYEKIKGIEIYDIIVHEKINLKNLEKTINKKNLKDIFNEFSLFFKEENGDIEKKIYLCNEFISFDVNNEKIKKMFNLRKDIQEQYKNDIKKKITYYSENHTIWKIVEEFWYDYNSSIIEKFENIINLSDKLKIQKEKTFEWLNEYIKFLKDNSTIVEKKIIFPDQNGNFRKINDLHSALEIPEILKEYVNELNRINNNNYDIRNKLLSDKIESYKNYNRLSQKEIISDIEEKFNKTNDNEEIQFKICEQIITILPSGDSNKFEAIRKALKEMISYYNKIYNKNLEEKIENIKAELNYGIFCSFILDKIFKKIEVMNGNEISSKFDVIPKIIKFAWDYQFNKYLSVSIDPKEK